MLTQNKTDRSVAITSRRATLMPAMGYGCLQGGVPRICAGEWKQDFFGMAEQFRRPAANIAAQTYWRLFYERITRRKAGPTLLTGSWTTLLTTTASTFSNMESSHDDPAGTDTTQRRWLCTRNIGTKSGTSFLRTTSPSKTVSENKICVVQRGLLNHMVWAAENSHSKVIQPEKNRISPHNEMVAK